MQFHEKIFGTKSIFCNFKNGQKSIFELEKSLKLPKMQFHEIDLFDFMSFLPRLFKIFWPTVQWTDALDSIAPIVLLIYLVQDLFEYTGPFITLAQNMKYIEVPNVRSDI